MSSEDPITAHKRPLPARPATGLMAWEATIGYMSNHLAPDALLKLQTYSRDARVWWTATVSWGNQSESTSDHPSLAAALRELWNEVSRNHTIFKNVEDAVRSPVNYDDADWLDLATQESLQRLIWVTQVAFPGDWLLVTVYQPVENAEMRVQMRLVAKGSSIAVGGRGANLLDACRILFRNATPHYSAQSNSSLPAE